MKLPATIVTRDLANPDSPPQEKLIDHDNRSDRIWLGNHIWHTTRNNKSVTIYPLAANRPS